MSIELLHVVISFSFMGVLTLCGLGYSYALASKGVWASQKVRGKKRKDGTYLQNLPLIFVNLFCAYGLTGLGMYYLHDLFINESFFGLNMPLPVQVALEVLAVIVIDDAFFYFLHRWFHSNKFVYQKIHIIHHRNQQPIPMEYIYAHPLEWIMGTGGLLLAIVLLQGIAFESFCVYLVFRTSHEYFIHSSLRSSAIFKLIPFYGTNEHHETHHTKFDCNYAATFTIWDKIFGTEVVE